MNIDRDEFGNTFMFEDDGKEQEQFERLQLLLAGLYIWIPLCLFGLPVLLRYL